MITLKAMAHDKQVHSNLHVFRLWPGRSIARFKYFLFGQFTRLLYHLNELWILVNRKYLLEDNRLVFHFVSKNADCLNLEIWVKNIVCFWLTVLLSLVLSCNFVILTNVVMMLAGRQKSKIASWSNLSENGLAPVLSRLLLILNLKILTYKSRCSSNYVN